MHDRAGWVKSCSFVTTTCSSLSADLFSADGQTGRQVYRQTLQKGMCTHEGEGGCIQGAGEYIMGYANGEKCIDGPNTATAVPTCPGSRLYTYTPSPRPSTKSQIVPTKLSCSEKGYWLRPAATDATQRETPGSDSCLVSYLFLILGRRSAKALLQT